MNRDLGAEREILETNDLKVTLDGQNSLDAAMETVVPACPKCMAPMIRTGG